MPARYLALLLLTACIDLDPDPPDPPIEPRPVRLMIIDSLDYVRPNNYAQAVRIHVAVKRDTCSTFDGLFEGTIGGVPAEILSRGGGQACFDPTLAVDAKAVTDATVVVRYGERTLTAELPAGALEGRRATQGSAMSWTMCPGSTTFVTWSHAADLLSSPTAKVDWLELASACAADCSSGAEFETSATINGDQLAVGVPSVALQWSGAGQALVSMTGATMQGEAMTCEGAQTCDYRFTHWALENATYFPSCP